MPMSGLDRKAELVRRGVTGMQIARELGYSSAHVSQVLLGTRRHERTEKAIAEKIGLPVVDVFGEYDKCVA